ncbi:undecaprenyl-diphosphate phosphatase [Paenibacillus polymyxa]|uniref:Undecaprenyl-diphosphatase n=1 Tax=Paenibacillus ottowii TaxID=2315729 RepID=A0ABY3B046_9BACL|nr:undecaprenyl-diphosphate phosphatase [Paenibacillus ottowii]NEU25775.1 undecaprenyl-diphosphate phosphatase [Paenibacillus polymyxa]QDY84191.1 undecaprenyl-diphosphate phosphatase [Paenibacillus polymyxa]TQR97027.1 undecaprenyl-diphosphate phosphatase [Paenibacillus ottowii]
MDILSSIIMGIIEGLTEFLPVSSTGHMILTADLLGLNTENDTVKTFEVIVQLGAVLAVVVLYWRRFLSLFDFRRKVSSQPRLNLLHIILAMIPAGLIGVLFRDVIKQYLFGPETVLYSLVIGGLLMIAAEKFHPPIRSHTLDEITYKQAFTIGVFQVLALWPGFSRSGSTMSGGLFARVSHTAAAEFTFLVSVPVMLGASGIDMIKSMDHLSMSDFPVFAAGFITAFIVGMLAIKTFLGLLKRLSLTSFAIYRFVLAAVFFFIIL